MSSEQTFSTGDLRSGTREFQRDKDQRVKWAHGPSFGPGRREEDGRPRPARVFPKYPNSGIGADRQKARVAVKNQISYASGGDSSADEEVEEASAAPVPDAEVTYSYDAAQGPSHGSQILGLALAKAIERFEVRETDKLIKEEYEVVDVDGEPVATAPAHNKGKKAVSEDEDDYEFV
ncbi:hypothetical protein K432DRAFT_376864 [Lepidopterella palustris CBS 459.81]|uniref:Uncharacterized protein n=1 Tax=Lepidopterella palustris CBS 459.81 TaxID=1314670 RepID=A0A8E2ELT2_9PEZI|nr:hypothetical protein K432DRAFT_376864 [Lepidopterella palustris CBS 459.81]